MTDKHSLDSLAKRIRAEQTKSDNRYEAAKRSLDVAATGWKASLEQQQSEIVAYILRERKLLESSKEEAFSLIDQSKKMAEKTRTRLIFSTLVLAMNLGILAAMILLRLKG